MMVLNSSFGCVIPMILIYFDLHEHKDTLGNREDDVPVEHSQRHHVNKKVFFFGWETGI